MGINLRLQCPQLCPALQRLLYICPGFFFLQQADVALLLFQQMLDMSSHAIVILRQNTDLILVGILKSSSLCCFSAAVHCEIFPADVS